MNYGEAMNEALRAALSESAPVLAFGQYIGAGSHLSGLTRGINDISDCTVLNTPNCENAQVGFGFGNMLQGANGIFIVKQQDFLLLCLDQLVNTANIAVRDGVNGSFTILFVTVDSGYEGPQSRLNNFSDFCALTSQPGFTLSSRQEAFHILRAEIGAPGFRMLGVSQRLFRTDVIDLPDARPIDSKNAAFQYRSGEDLTVIACNFALSHALKFASDLEEAGISAAVYSAPRVDPDDCQAILRAISDKGPVLIADDSHSKISTGRQIAWHLSHNGIECLLVDRANEGQDLAPNADAFVLEMDSLLQQLRL